MPGRYSRGIAQPAASRGQVEFPHQFTFPAGSHVVEWFGPHWYTGFADEAMKLGVPVQGFILKLSDDVFLAFLGFIEAFHLRAFEFRE